MHAAGNTTTDPAARIALLQTARGELEVVIAERRIAVYGSGIVVIEDVDHHNQDETDIKRLAAKATCRVGYTYLDSGFRIVHVYDDADEFQFGYSLNLDEPAFSEWGDTCIKDWKEYVDSSDKEKAALRDRPDVIVATEVLDVVLGAELVQAVPA